ncbi:lipoyl synthase [Candidatus Ruminimicrobium bovinum]|uniref:lipoyl synthase n=1 Tax=Candidatus Ruminimicrobium bovinum TaxID=3242779 RepID=UPI0039B9542B
MDKKRISLADLDLLKQTFNKYGLHTVCQSAKCPNIGECFKNKTATFMILGNICTRNCDFCATQHGIPLQQDMKEPMKLANIIKILKLKYVVITSVTRDDLPDGGAMHFKNVVDIINREIPDIKIELLVPDFKGIKKNIDIVLSSKFNIFGHNIETVPNLYKFRKGADYKRSLNVLAYAKEKGFIIKTGIMLGLGETEKELLEVFKDLKNINCDILTIGQYLKPLKNNAEMLKEYSDEEFEYLKQKALEAGIKICVSGKYVRSSYFADNTFKKITSVG